ncbi:hypothetical protein AFGD_008715 [Aspergillus flavus]|nr:hypothetical protein AFGD_008715 [Aspergillus flavus]
MADTNGLVIAFFYESISLYRSRGYSEEDCVELDKQETIDAIAASIQSNGHRVVCVGDIKELVQRMAREEHKEWDLAFSISEGMHGVGREAQIPGLLEAYQIPHVFSDAATLALCLDKGKTKMILEQFGIPTAPFAVVPASWTKADCTLTQLLEKTMHGQKLSSFPLFIKPACEGSSKGIYPSSKVDNFTELERGIQMLQTRFPGASILIETFLSGQEYTVSIIGTGKRSRVIGTTHIDWEGLSRQKQQASVAEKGPVNSSDGSFWDVNNKNGPDADEPERFLNSRENPNVQAVEDLALQAWRALECCDVGRVDIRYGADNRPYVLEINPLPGLRPNWSILARTAVHEGISHKELIGKVIDSALERYPILKAKCDH